ncbi:MAG: nuclear transport factor 2 family protein [Proteobacteria bacterium]|nr:nuclear transport factor 2 family protein [Pseudomonadota bacterium]
MKHCLDRSFGSRYFALVSVLALASCQRAGTPSSTTEMPAQATLEAELSVLNKRLAAAYEANDVDTLEAMLAPDHIHNNVFGMRMDKDTFLADIHSGVLVFERYDTDAIKWFIYQDVAIATGTIEAVAYRSGKQVPGTRFTFTRVFVRRGDAWQVMLFQNTIVQPSPARSVP